MDVADVKTVETYVIVSIPPDPKKMSINLKGPILINTKTKKAKQLVLVNSTYKVIHYMVGGKPESDRKIEKRKMADVV